MPQICQCEHTKTHTTQITQMSTQARSQIYSVADRIRYVRGNETQAQFSKRVGISRSALANYETGRSKPNAFALRQISEKTGHPLSFFDNQEINEADDWFETAKRSVLEGAPKLTDDELSLIRCLRMCDDQTVGQLVETIQSAIEESPYRGTYEQLLFFDTDMGRLEKIRRLDGRYARGEMLVDSEKLYSEVRKALDR